ncbi:MAG: tRNA pseudouridine(55) synthase TruB, partial [Clostridiales bacterium]|nr:tRNA pseudouridine(55) synthase TruB [Clostridiales bacterium]
MKGFINVIKPAGMSSAYAVGAVKKKFNCPCGHMGTLDPMASGVLPVGLGKTSRLFDYLLDKTKTYVATFKFGLTTDTLDSTGSIIDSTDYIPTETEIEEKLKDFIGDIEQVPPKYSAKCIDGKRGYQLARRNI